MLALSLSDCSEWGGHDAHRRVRRLLRRAREIGPPRRFLSALKALPVLATEVGIVAWAVVANQSFFVPLDEQTGSQVTHVAFGTLLSPLLGVEIFLLAATVVTATVVTAAVLDWPLRKARPVSCLVLAFFPRTGLVVGSADASSFLLAVWVFAIPCAALL